MFPLYGTIETCTLDANPFQDPGYGLIRSLTQVMLWYYLRNPCTEERRELSGAYLKFNLYRVNGML